MLCNSFKVLQQQCEEIIKKGWIECPDSNTGNVGLLLERLLGLENHNLSIPDYEEIEIKTKLINSAERLTLFNATPDSHLFEIKRIHDLYGYPDSTHKQFKVFNVAFYSNYRSYINKHIYGKIYVNRIKEKVSLRFFNNQNQLIDEETSWSFQLLKERINLKLKFLFIMYAKRKTINKKSYCKYLQYSFFAYKNFDAFLSGIEKGIIRITFNIGVYKNQYRYGKIHDHGTSFNIDLNHIEKVFTKRK